MSDEGQVTSSPITHHPSRFLGAALLALAVQAPGADAQCSAPRPAPSKDQTAPPATARDYPARPIRLVAATSPGGITDFLARVAAAELAPTLGQNVVVDNRPGAAGS